MKIYTIPAMSMGNEFSDLAFVGRYVDQLISSSGDQDYSLVLEWDSKGPGSGRSPIQALVRMSGGAWSMRDAPQVSKPSSRAYSLNRYHSVNGH